eukprot:CAMPEP_0197292384 /NCGR_PEP_ID=MMETSP0890-20130614/22816_1 /TAXON_ID=44058 ORGANISM="Aureoumbra lagunensis, Strain CCMP1510" /NCGR_SAMPLE_ID=MMETSP0890 /ASSEMBLY_ACC=CAM_ASM_000533 /LENGTH=490 /DNA_ID=CAMNT_0042766219 /DNA_START=684 /DNA_END=2156 /DNA_ORIENTATION=+
MAFGNGAPDVFTAWNAIESASDASLVLAELLGACMFIITVVLGFVILAAHGRRRNGSCQVDPFPFARDTLSLAICVFSLCACVLDGRIQLVESVAVIALYICYLLVIIGSRPDGGLATCGQYFCAVITPRGTNHASSTESVYNSSVITHPLSHNGHTRNRTSSVSSDEIELRAPYQAVNIDEEVYNQDVDTPIGGARRRPGPELSLRGVHWSATHSTLSKVIHIFEYPFSLLRHVTIPAATFEPSWGPARRRLVAIATAGSGLIFAFEFAGPIRLIQNASNFIPIPLGIIIFFIGCIAGFLVFKSSADDTPPSLSLKTILVVIGFLSCVAWLDLLASETCAVLESLGAASGVSSAVLGVTALAWGNCIGDLVADTAVARAGNSKAAVASVFNSPLFSQVLSLGFPVMYYTMYKGPLNISIDTEAVLSFIGVAFCLFLTTIVCACSGASLPRRYAFVLFTIYGVYMILSLILALRAANIRAEEIEAGEIKN